LAQSALTKLVKKFFAFRPKNLLDSCFFTCYNWRPWARVIFALVDFALAQGRSAQLLDFIEKNFSLKINGLAKSLIYKGFPKSLILLGFSSIRYIVSRDMI
jgi:hypothetical protein